MQRREWLVAVGGVACTLAGCVGTGSDAGPDHDTEADRDGDATATPTGEVADESADEAADESADEAIDEPPVHEGYDTTEVRVKTPDGDELGRVTAAIADTNDLRHLGLSDTESLPTDRGMLFVYGSEREGLTFVMREMDFGIDIVYADAEGVITRIHHAPAPGPDEDGNEQGYPGDGQYVLEVGYEWTTARGVEEGDVLEFDLEE